MSNRENQRGGCQAEGRATGDIASIPASPSALLSIPQPRLHSDPWQALSRSPCLSSRPLQSTL